MNLQGKSTANASTTTELLNKYLGEQLKSYSIDPKFGAYAMENTFGEKIHAQVEGFCKFAEEGGFNAELKCLAFRRPAQDRRFSGTCTACHSNHRL